MNRHLPTLQRALAAFAVCLLQSALPASGQNSGYQSPTFFGQSGPTSGMAAPMPASPLAGGMPAAGGDAYMDAHGQPIVMPASYCQSCPGGAGGGGCGYGDPMAVDFGGYASPDQCGPHYFDVAFETVFLQGEDLFQNVVPFTSVGAGVNAPRFLDIERDFGEYEPGWQIAARYDVGPLSMIEATYMGLYDISFRDQVRSVDVAPGGANFQLFSVFSNFGTGTLVPGIDDGLVHRLDYESDLQSTEISFRRYWVGNNPRVSGSLLMGFRYLRMTEDLNFSSDALVIAAVESASRLWSSENDLLGFQVGGDGWICLRQGLRFGCEGKAGIYNNRFKFRHMGDFPAAGPADFDVTAEGNDVAFAAEGDASFVADILPSWSLRGGYRVMYMNSLATVGNNIDPTNVSSTAVLTTSDALYHGFHGGLEYVW